MDFRNSRDGFGRLFSDSHDDADTVSHNPLKTSSNASGLGTGSTEDTRLRSSLETGTGWKFAYSPDATGKLASSKIGLAGSTLQDFATWRYLGSQALAKTQIPGNSASQYVATGYTFNSLRYLTNIATTYGTGGTGTTIYNLTMNRDVEGNVLDNQYTKVNGRAGDWFQLDGFDRLKEAKMGVTGFADWSTVTYDTRTAYGLDSAQNRTQVDNQAWGQSTQTTTYTLERGANRYRSVGNSGYAYDVNVNLGSDGWFVYVYD